MYGMTGKLTAQPGKRAEFVQILLQGAELVGKMPGCRMYLINEDLDDENTIWVFELWDDKKAHDASLQDERVRAVIAEARPIMESASAGAQFRYVGGYGLPSGGEAHSK
jgi:quinol monooxygenase YgiN